MLSAGNVLNNQNPAPWLNGQKENRNVHNINFSSCFCVRCGWPQFTLFTNQPAVPTFKSGKEEVMGKYVIIRQFPEPPAPEEFKSLARVNELFDLWGYSRWEKETTESFLPLFEAAVKEIVAYQEGLCTAYAALPWYKQKWLAWKKQQPCHYSYEEICLSLIRKLRRFSEWMGQKQYSNFFRDSDMSAAINKPLSLASQLEISCVANSTVTATDR